MKKMPRQERSRSLIDSIFEAATRILTEKSTEAGTTNEIAEKAGVGVGSLYEYFPGKEAIFASLIKLDLAHNERLLKAHVQTLQGRPVREKIRSLVDFGVDQFLQNQKMKVHLFRHVYRFQKVQEVLTSWDAIARIFADLMREHERELALAADKADLAAYMISHMVQGLLITRLFTNKSTHSIEDLKTEIVSICESYLVKRES